MGFLSKTGRLFALPFIKPLEQIKVTSEQIKSDFSRYKHLKEIRLETIEAQRLEHMARVNSPEWQGFRPTEDEIKNPLLIKDPYLRFKVVSETQCATEESLEVQRVAIARTKVAAMVLACIFLLLSVIGMVFLPFGLLILVEFALFVAVVFSLSTCFSSALMQSQIEQKKLMPFFELMARRDFFSYLFKGPYGG